MYKSFDALCTEIAAALPGRSAVLDGEIVHLDSEGKPQFCDLLRRRNPQQFVAFDVLWLDGKDLTRTPLVQRKRILRAVVPPGLASLLYADHFDANGKALFRVVCEVDMEGIVAKRKDGLYTPEATSWVKIKNPSYTQAEGRRELFERRRSAVA